MDSALAVKLDPKETSDTLRQQALERIVFNPAPPDPDLWRSIIPILEKEPVKWIRQLEVRLLKRLPFNIDFATAGISLLGASLPEVRLEGAKLLNQLIDRLVTEKNAEALHQFEETLLASLLTYLKSKEITAQQDTWVALYQTLANLTPTEQVSEEMSALLPSGGDTALYIFSQYVQKSHPLKCLDVVLSALSSPHLDEVTIHLLRALTVTLPKKGTPTGYANSDATIQCLLEGLKGKSENVRVEAADALTNRAKVAKKTTVPLPLEDAVWDAVFLLYKNRLHAPLVWDKNSARSALAALPITQERLSRLFELMRQVTDAHEKQDVVGLIGLFKTSETRDELILLLRDNFPGLRLDAQKVIIDAVSIYLPDDEIEVELDKLFAGRLHADILGKLGDKLLAPLPSLKKRLLYWLGLNEKTKRPLLERFDLPMMHIKIIQAARRLKDDREIHEKLMILEPLLMMNDAILKMHETLKAFPPAPKQATLSMSELFKSLMDKIDPLPKAHILFSGFSLPEGFGESQELEFGNADQSKEQGLGLGAAEMGKNFVKQAIEDLFAEDSEIDLPADTQFRLEEGEGGKFTVTAITATS